MSESTLPADLIDALRYRLPRTAEQSVTAIVAEVPAYRGALTGQRGQRITRAVELALQGFVETAGLREAASLRAVQEGAYLLGRDEARSGRSMDALLAAYRVGARVAWQELSEAASSRADADLVVRFAGLVFAYIDELSAASARGHHDELTDVEVERQRRLEQVAHRLLLGEDSDAVRAATARTSWLEPTTLTAILAPQEQAPGVRQRLPLATLQAGDYTAETVSEAGVTILLVPDLSRRQLLAALASAPVIIGPAAQWMMVRSSLLRAESARKIFGFGLGALDVEAHLVPLVVGADPAAYRDLQARALQAFDVLKPAPRQRLLDTLRSWLLHQGRREAVAEELFVHPQTVRYRVGQLRELLGDQMDNPRWCEAAIVALAATPIPHPTHSSTRGVRVSDG